MSNPYQPSDDATAFVPANQVAVLSPGHPVLSPGDPMLSTGHPLHSAGHPTISAASHAWLFGTAAWVTFFLTLGSLGLVGSLIPIVVMGIGVMLLSLVGTLCAIVGLARRQWLAAPALLPNGFWWALLTYLLAFQPTLNFGC